MSDPNASLGRRRKSPQWFGLRREHAEVVVHDQDFLDVMREYCVADQMIDGRRDCCLPLSSLLQSTDHSLYPAWTLQLVIRDPT